VSCAKTAVSIGMQFGMLTRVGPGNHALDCGAQWRRLANTSASSVCGSDAALCQITLTACTNCHNVRGVLASENRRKRSSVGSSQSPMVDEERISPLLGVSSLCFLQCFDAVGWVTGRKYGQ